MENGTLFSKIEKNGYPLMEKKFRNTHKNGYFFSTIFYHLKQFFQKKQKKDFKKIKKVLHFFQKTCFEIKKS